VDLRRVWLIDPTSVALPTQTSFIQICGLCSLEYPDACIQGCHLIGIGRHEDYRNVWEELPSADQKQLPDDDDIARDLRNGLLMCASCHAAYDAGQIYIAHNTGVVYYVGNRDVEDLAIPMADAEWWWPLRGTGYWPNG